MISIPDCPTEVSGPICPLISRFALKCIIAISSSIVIFQAQVNADVPSLGTSVSWENIYFLEGRDMLEGSSILAFEECISWNTLSAAVAYLYSEDSDYRELNLSTGIFKNTGNIEYGASLTALTFYDSDETDQELGVYAIWEGLPANWNLGVDLYYSKEAEGWFGEIMVAKDWFVGEESILSVEAACGTNGGYIPDGHEGLNNLSLTCCYTITVNENVSIHSFAGYSHALNVDTSLEGDANLENLFRYGISAICEF